jgi:hypothetical protein
MRRLRWPVTVTVEDLPGGLNSVVVCADGSRSRGVRCGAVRCGAVRCGAVRCVSSAGVSTQASTMAAAEKEQGSRSKIAGSLWRSGSSSPIRGRTNGMAERTGE